MLSISNWIPFCILMLLNAGIYAQVVDKDESPKAPSTFEEISQITEQTYGINQELICGELYENLYQGAYGTPFLIKEEFTNGSVVYKGIKYNDLQLMYDIYEHKLLLEYKFERSHIRVYLTNSFLTEFEIYNKEFKKLDLFDEDPKFYQVMEAGKNLTYYCYWLKSRTESNHLYPRISYEFSKDKRKRYLYINGDFSSFRGKNSFIAAFPKIIRKPIKKYLKQNQIYIAECSDTAMQQLLEYCNSLLNTNGPTTEN